MLQQENERFLAELDTLQQQKSFAQAADYLADRIESLLESTPHQTIERILANFPGELFDENTDLLFISGFVAARTSALVDALNLLERARFSYTVTHQNYARAVLASLELVRLHLSRENFHTARHYLQEVVRPMLERQLVMDPKLHARYCLRMSELCPDIGEMKAGVDYARQALAISQSIHDLSGQFYALIRVAGSSVHLGEYAEAESKLELARTCWSIGGLGDLARARLLNVEVHLNWNQGKLQEALNFASEYLTLADQEAHSHFRVYARILLGNLHRELGQFETAQKWYNATRQVAADLDHRRYFPWIDVQTAWLRILENRLAEARKLIHASLKTSDLGQAMSFQVFLAVLNVLEDRLEVACRLLLESLAFYSSSGDELTCCAIRFYLAYAAKKQQDLDAAYQHLNVALRWMAQRRISRFPHWWHPPIIAQVCTYALAVDLYPDVIERMLVHQLGEAGVQALRTMLEEGEAAARARAYQIYQIVASETVDELSQLRDSQAKRVLATLLKEGKLRREGLPRLQAELTTAQRRNTPNATIMAVFVLYVNGRSRTEIAEMLKCSVANVRNYITVIYHLFGLANSDFPTRRSRQRRLMEIARDRGFI